MKAITKKGRLEDNLPLKKEEAGLLVKYNTLTGEWEWLMGKGSDTAVLSTKMILNLLLQIGKSVKENQDKIEKKDNQGTTMKN